jgi:hypothetical protein
METSWWLDWSALPDLLWAPLQVATDGSAVVLDLDGRYHRFPDGQSARLWLNEDEYLDLAHLVESEEVGREVVPPSAPSDQELIPLTCVRQGPAFPARDRCHVARLFRKQTLITIAGAALLASTAVVLLCGPVARINQFATEAEPAAVLLAIMRLKGV